MLDNNGDVVYFEITGNTKDGNVVNFVIQVTCGTIVSPSPAPLLVANPAMTPACSTLCNRWQDTAV